MIKRFYLALAILAGLFSPAHSAGTIGLSLTQRFDAVTTKPLNGGKLYFIQAGTTSTPQNAFQDSALTIPWPNPMTLDAGGNVPQLFFADGQIKIRLTNSAGVNQLVADNILVVGASSGGGGGGTVDPTTILTTGDVKSRYGTGLLTGFVRLNGRTIGSATSGATERANADAQALFEYLWGADANLVVSTGRGASANADWVANKTIALPDARSRALAGLGDMGNSDNALFSGVTFTSGNSTTLGSPLGAARRTLTAAQIPTITSLNSNPFSVVSTSTRTDFVFNALGVASTSAGLGGANGLLTSTAGGVSAVTSGGTVAINQVASASNNTGGGAHDTVSPFLLITVYQKL